MKHSVSSLVLLVVLVILSSLVAVAMTRARLGYESASAHDDETQDPTHHLDLVTMKNDDLPELQDASIARKSTSTTLLSDRDLQQRGGSRSRNSRSFLNPNRDENDVESDSFVRVMVGFKNDEGRTSARRFADGSRAGAQRWQEMKNLRVGIMIIPKSSLETLRRNPNIEYVEEDGIIMPESETTPIGIAVSQGGSSNIIPATSSSSGGDGACNDPNSFRVAIVDSGIQVNHPDIPCRNINAANSNCIGVSIGIDGEPWWAPATSAWHGTHVFGTVAAVGNNGQGVTSMVPDSEASGICYMIVRVFNDAGSGQFTSVLFQGIDWAISEGANVINMSLSGSFIYKTGQATFNTANAAGILSVAAAGNEGRASLRYPASYDHVISVAATDNSGRRASFSQSNRKVNIAAPGVSVLSTVAGGGYASSTGTSMSTPHVTGAIARVWSVCRSCSAAHVEQCLLSTAGSGNGSRTNDIGYGLVHAEDTYMCLVGTVKCCAQEEVGPPTSEPTNAPVPAPPVPAAPVPAPVPVDEDLPEPVPGPTDQEPVSTAPVPAPVPTAPKCRRRQVDEPCRRDAQCCSDKCDTVTGKFSRRKTCSA